MENQEKQKDNGYAGATSVENLEINLMYIMAMALERLANDIEWRLKLKRRSFRLEKKMRFNNIINSIRNIKMNADVMDQIDFAEGLRGKYEFYQGYQEDAQRLLRILLLLADRDAEDGQNLYDVQKLLRSQKGIGLVTEDVLKNFYLQKYNG